MTSLVIDAVVDDAGSDGRANLFVDAVADDAGFDSDDAGFVGDDAASDGGDEIGGDGIDSNEIGGDEIDGSGTGTESDGSGSESDGDDAGSESDGDDAGFDGSTAESESGVKDANDKPEYPFFKVAASSPVEMKEISAFNDAIILDGAEGVLDASYLQAFESLFPDIEKRYINQISIGSVDDDDETAYSPEIIRSLCAVSHYLRIRRKRRYLYFFADSYEKRLPDFLEQDFKICDGVLNQDSQELQFLGKQPGIQIKCTGELDAAIHMTELMKGHLPTFWFARRSIFKKLDLLALSRFQAVFKVDGVWNPAQVEHGGPLPYP